MTLVIVLELKKTYYASRNNGKRPSSFVIIIVYYVKRSILIMFREIQWPFLSVKYLRK